MSRLKLDQNQIRQVPCIACDANPGDYCRDKKQIQLLACHQQREQLANKLPSIFDEDKLTATEKALICYYGFVMVCDSVSANSEKTFGTKISTREVQSFFAKRAIKELVNDGLLGAAPAETKE